MRRLPTAAVAADYGWTVVYTPANGQVVHRSDQFGMTDESDNTKTQWTGWLNKNSNKWMRGRVMRKNSNGHLIYVEELFDRKNTLLSLNWIDCGQDSTPTYDPPVVASAPAPAPAVKTIVPASAPTQTASDHVPFIYAQGGMHISASLSGYPVTMVIDTGATALTVPETLASRLVANGQAIWTGDIVEVTLADGSTRKEREISINTLTVGSHTIQGALGHVSPDGSDLLLGITVLARLSPKFAINTQLSTLDFD